MLLYRIISILLYPFLELYLFYRVIKKKEDKHRLKERFGRPSCIRPDGQIIWLHAVSVGEANSALILIDEIFQSSSNASILLTTTTITSAAIIQNKLQDFKGRLIHQYVPIDSYFCVQDFFSFWRPSAVIFVESEIWPNMIYEANRLEIPSFLVNARISQKSFKKWHLAKKLGFNIFDYFTVIFAQMAEDVELFSKLTCGEVLFFGNLKSQAQTLSVNNEELQKLKSQIGDRKFWLAASTHKGEEEYVIAAHQELKKEFPDLLTIIILRHPNRADEVKALLNGIKFSQRSKNETITNSSEIYLVDTLGELGIFYSLASFTFLGGSLFTIGGHNPFEPIKLNCVVISGRGVANFREIYQQLEANDAGILIDDGKEMAAVVKELLNEEGLCGEIMNNASAVIRNSDDVAKKIFKKIAIDRIWESL